MRYRIRTTNGIEVDEGLMAVRQSHLRYAGGDNLEYRIEINTARRSTLSNILATISSEIKSFDVALPYNTEIRLSESNYDLVLALIAEEIEANYEGLHKLFTH